MRAFAIVLFALATWLACPGVALAFHTGSTFGERAEDGGGGGIFYVGLPLERGWDCTMCHTDSPGRMKIAVEVDPPELFENFRYEVGAMYSFSVKMVWQDGATELGLAAGRSNFNSISVGVADAEGLFAGTLQGGSDFFAGSGAGTIASEVDDGVTSWAFNWFAPAEAGRGTVKLHFAAVDGNGADSDPELTRSDPFNDDVFVTQVTFQEGGATAAAGHGSAEDAARGWAVSNPPGSGAEPAARRSSHVKVARTSNAVAAGTAGIVLSPNVSILLLLALCLMAPFAYRRRQRVSATRRNDH